MEKYIRKSGFLYHILYSYGSWVEIFSYLESVEIVKMQALHTFMYQKGVARCLSKHKVCWLYFTICCSAWSRSLFEVNFLDQQTCTDSFVSDILDFGETQCVTIRSSFFVFKAATSVRVTKIVHPMSKTLRRIISLPSPPMNSYNGFFHVTNINDEYIIKSGGHNDENALKVCFLLNLSTNTWLQVDLPQLNTARYMHSSCCVSN